ncbi:MAG: bifunctional phosphoribosyl-AMP cyclohydrolase/phosphoribosyl-ATP diphosphatase HisIE [Candidatus Methanofastidiosa archaeon]|nr:bifunctional phosphoribosyl-AMP cyclohydrolase/phosphoribosyl-ATP diphosphatase HisIE [Candidatus Methanofastidiosa archaeon]
MIIPSIDLMDGKAVQLEQGKKKMLERENVLELAKEFGRFGEIAVIDLDAAMGQGDNLELIKEIVKIADCRVGGGIRTPERGRELLRSGAKRIIIGTSANREFLKNFRREDVIVAIDSRGGRVTDMGWKNDTKVTPEQRIAELKEHCSGFLFTDVEREGRLKGFDLELAKRMREAVPKGMSLTAAGGITTIEEIKELDRWGMDCQLGMSIYTGRILLEDAFSGLIDFEKCGGLVPTIVQEANGEVLMLAYSNRDSLKYALKNGRGAYHSRSRDRLWVKGEESGNTQELVRVAYDCDRDTLLFTVRQNGAACHTGSYSCFGERKFSLEELYATLRERIESGDERSYTYRTAKNERGIMEKISEESKEVVTYKDRPNLVWEIADLTYFLLMLMAKKNIEPDEIVKELRGRRR